MSSETPNRTDMNDSLVLVTGGAGNVGSAVTRAFLESGARVAVPVYKTDRPDALDEMRSHFAERLHSFALDLTTERGAEAAVRDVMEWGGNLDAVIHMIGGYSGGTLLADTSLEVWDRMIALNLTSAFLVARATMPALLEGGGGALVFVSARAARRERKASAAYAVAKAGVLTLAEAIAEEYGSQGIRSNVVLPGTVDTEANRRVMPDADHGSWTRPEEIARVILFLASDHASAVNGAAVPVYGRS
jgi:NAD(P)-dependent dehydrogenase (short-subunit alcohol dehydrogenase family)